ncbi:MAG: 6-phosphogluconolactonase, partial [Prolixibacteraceae bacterium]|nr:6-phosphogluconolactonase [Prolixibacteraceae bacterium]
MVQEIKSFKKDNLKVKVYNETEEMGIAAANFVADQLKAVIAEKGSANLILATGASQFAFIQNFQKLDVDWKKITVFHLDEYKGLPETHPASFRKYLKERILDIVKPKEVHYLEGDAADIDAEIKR